jgi:hypothetical protein
MVKNSHNKFQWKQIQYLKSPGQENSKKDTHDLGPRRNQVHKDLLYGPGRYRDSTTKDFRPKKISGPRGFVRLTTRKKMRRHENLRPNK